MRIYSFLILAFLVLSACHSKPPAKAERPTAARNGPALSNLESGIVAEVNRYRQSIGLPALQVNSIIATEAALHSQKMARHQVGFGHDGFQQRVSRINSRLDGSIASGENVAAGSMTAKEVVQFWIKSKPHRQNIEGKFNLTGIGISRDSRGSIYYTQIFILK